MIKTLLLPVVIFANNVAINLFSSSLGVAGHL
mgnify:CR=1 FL=1